MTREPFVPLSRRRVHWETLAQTQSNTLGPWIFHVGGEARAKLEAANAIKAHQVLREVSSSASTHCLCSLCPKTDREPSCNCYCALAPLPTALLLERYRARHSFPLTLLLSQFWLHFPSVSSSPQICVRPKQSPFLIYSGTHFVRVHRR